MARDDFRTQLGQKALVAVGIFDKEVVGRHGLDDRIAQILQTFVVDWLAALDLHRGRLMNKGQLVEFDVVRQKAEQIIDHGIEFFILPETTAEGSEKKIKHSSTLLRVGIFSR